MSHEVSYAPCNTRLTLVDVGVYLGWVQGAFLGV